MDVSDEASTAAAFDEAEAAMGGRIVDVLINNAGVAKPAIVLRTTPADWDELMGTNLRGAFFVAQQACKRCTHNCSTVLQLCHRIERNFGSWVHEP